MPASALLPLTLGLWRSGNGAASPLRAPTSKQKAHVLARDSSTCRCCGFTSAQFQSVLPGKGLLSGTEDTFVTLCPFCALCLMLDRVGFMGAGTLIWLPEMSQADLHHVLRAIYVARLPGTPPAVAEAAGRALEALQARRTEAKKRLGSDDPFVLATVFQEELSEDDYAARGPKIEGIRLLLQDKWWVRGPGGVVDQFPAMAAFWRSPEGPYAKVPTDSWVALFERVTAEESPTRH